MKWSSGTIVRRGLLAAMMALAMPSAVWSQARPDAIAPVPAPATPADLAATQQKLLALLRVSPTLTDVVAADPTLLVNQEYVGRSNPELAQFLLQHAEVTRNPAFYLFADLREPGQRHYDLLVPKEGFEHARGRDERSGTERTLDQIGPLFALICCLAAAFWLIRLLVGNRRWARVFKLQSEVHGKLIEKFGTSQELMAYMETDAGRRFLEAAPISTESDNSRMPNMVSRVLLTTQIGVVLTLLGGGLLGLRNSVGDGGPAMLVMGIVVLMPGLGFMISAAITWVVARRLGLMPSGLDGSNSLAADAVERR